MSDTPTAAPAAVRDIENVEPVELNNLIARVEELKAEKQRFLSATCMDMGENFHIYYHFDKKLVMLHLLLIVPKETEIPSISHVYMAAFLVENEMNELFGARITDIVIDYHGRLLLTEESDPAPMAKSYIVQR